MALPLSPSGYPSPVFVSLQRETAMRDKWVQRCANNQWPIAFYIASDKSDRGSVRINACTVDRCLGPAGQAIARAIAAEHGGHVRRIDDTHIEVVHITAAGAQLLLQRVLAPEHWFPVEPERQYWI